MALLDVRNKDELEGNWDETLQILGNFLGDFLLVANLCLLAIDL